jgi:hypothetical protein
MQDRLLKSYGLLFYYNGYNKVEFDVFRKNIAELNCKVRVLLEGDVSIIKEEIPGTILYIYSDDYKNFQSKFKMILLRIKGARVLPFGGLVLGRIYQLDNFEKTLKDINNIFNQFQMHFFLSNFIFVYLYTLKIVKQQYKILYLIKKK